MKLCAFVLCCTLFSSVEAFAVQNGVKELTNNSNLPSIVQKYVKCFKPSDCKNGGICSGYGTNRHCWCLKGTSGDFCKTVSVCESKDCGEDAKCAYDIPTLSGICKCNDDKLAFDETGNICKKKCVDDSDCKNGGTCSGDDTDRHCRCLIGISGDFCETASVCESKECGEDATCVYDIPTLSGICKCNDDKLAFDDTGNICKKKCVEMSDCKNGGTCSGDDTNRHCWCLKGTSGDFCERVSVCESKDCGEDAKCVYDIPTLSGICKCNDDKLAFDETGNICKKKCVEPSDCKNGGTCSGDDTNRHCLCLKGTSGDFCETVSVCESKDCGGDAKCVYDLPTLSGICKCNDDKLAFDETGKICKIPEDFCSNVVPHCEDTGGKCIFDQSQTAKCSCPTGTDYDKKVGCKVLDDFCDIEHPKCRPTRGSCSVEKGTNNIKCYCKGSLIYNKERGCDVIEYLCKLETPMCESTGGTCLADPGRNTATCECPANIIYNKRTGCKVPDDLCDRIYSKCRSLTRSCYVEKGTNNIKCTCKASPFYGIETDCDVREDTCKEKKNQCLETGGFCKSEATEIQCICPSDMLYDKNSGCQVIEDTCKQKKKECVETGGSCKLKTSGLECICPYPASYFDNAGCQVTVGRCKKVKPKCEYTGGRCLFYLWDYNYVECACPTGYEYTEDDGCIDLSTPRNLKSTCYSNTSICLKWDEPTMLIAPILCYEIHWFNSSGSGWERSVSNNTSHTMKHLAPFVEYSFRVAAVTETGTGKMSEKLDIRTAIGVPHAPRNLTVTKMTNTTAELKWDEPLISTGPIITHRVRWQKSSRTGEEETRSAATFYTLRNLTPNVNYTFEVTALTAAGPGAWSRRVIGQTKLGDLTPLDDSGDDIFISVFFKNRSLSTDSKFDFHFSRKETSNRTITELLLRLNSKSVVRLPDDKCSLISCQNGGTCEVKYEKAVCTCTDEYIGDDCEKNKCSIIKCQNGGKCQIKNGKAICACSENYVGEYCEYHECTLIKCKNGGKCEIKNGNVGCICPDSYTGDYCETDKCSLVPCKNGGKCDLINGKAICTCHDNYTGDLCETDKCSLIRCHNGGKCDVKNGKAVCVCNDEHIGDFCEIDKCSLIRCLNGGKCEIKNQKAVCVCNDKFTGDNCEKRIA